MATSAASSVLTSLDESQDISSSSEEDSDSDDNLCEDVIVEEGEREMILVSCKKVSCTNYYL